MRRLNWFSGGFEAAIFVASLLTIVVLGTSSALGQQSGGGAGPLLFPEESVLELDRFADIPYFTELGGTASTLTLNNNTQELRQAVVTVFNRKGESFQASPVAVPPNVASRFAMKDLTAGAIGDFSSGNLRIAYSGPEMAVTAQVTVASQTDRVSFESVETERMDFESSRLDGIISLPDAATQASAAITNVAEQVLTVVVTGTNSTRPRRLRLHPRETRLVDLRDFLAGSAAALVTIEHKGLSGDVIVTGFALNPKTGFSSNVHFIDCATARSTRLAGAHMRFGAADPGEGFPAGTSFLAPLLVANTSSVETEAHVFVDYTSESESKQVDLGVMSLAPKEVKQLELAQELMRHGVSGPVKDAGVEISYTGSSGSVIAQLASVDKSGDFAFDVPIKDPLVGLNGVRGNYPLRLDSAHSTVLHLKNILDKDVWAVVQVRYERGSYNPDRIKLAPHQSIAIDMRELRDAQKNDVRGGVMPKDVVAGQVVWWEEERGSIVGRAEVFNVQAGIASSFSCGGGCSCGPWLYDWWMSPSSAISVVGDAGYTFAPLARTTDCSSAIYGPFDYGPSSNWSSSNTSVATVVTQPGPNWGYVTCLGAGTTNIQALWQLNDRPDFVSNTCPTALAGGPAPLAVCDYQITSGQFNASACSITAPEQTASVLASFTPSSPPSCLFVSSGTNNCNVDASGYVTFQGGVTSAHCPLDIAPGGGQVNSNFGYFATGVQPSGNAGAINVALTLRVNTKDLSRSRNIPVVCPP